MAPPTPDRRKAGGEFAQVAVPASDQVAAPAAGSAVAESRVAKPAGRTVPADRRSMAVAPLEPRRTKGTRSVLRLAPARPIALLPVLFPRHPPSRATFSPRVPPLRFNGLGTPAVAVVQADRFGAIPRWFELLAEPHFRKPLQRPLCFSCRIVRMPRSGCGLSRTECSRSSEHLADVITRSPETPQRCKPDGSLTSTWEPLCPLCSALCSLC